MRDEIDHALIEVLLCAADLARMGYENPLREVRDRIDADPNTTFEAVCEIQAVAPRCFEYRNDLLAETILEAAYRVAEGRGIGGVA